MNVRKYAWQILHAEIRRRADDEYDESQGLHPELENIGLLLKQAREERISESAIIIDLAGFGATYALMPRTDNDPLRVADEIELAVMSESDEEDDRKDDTRWFEKWAEEHPLLDDDNDEDRDDDGDD
jgi:hypothetical protein